MTEAINQVPRHQNILNEHVQYYYKILLDYKSVLIIKYFERFSYPMKYIKFLRLGLFIATTIISHQAIAQNSIQYQEQIDSLFLEYDSPQKPGIAAIVFYKNQIFYKKGFGASNIEHNVIVHNETKFRVAAMGKRIIALTLQTLLEKGSVALDDRITKYLPELEGIAKDIDVRNLIMHTSGLYDIKVLKELSIEPGMIFNKNAALDLISRQSELEFIPGTKYANRSTNLFLISLIIERITNSNFSEYIRKNIFQAIEMHNSTFSFDKNAILKHKADSYEIDKDIVKLDDSNYKIFDGSNFYTTLNDLERWFKFELNPPKEFKNAFIKLDEPALLDIDKPVSLNVTTPTFGQEMFYMNSVVPVQYQFGNDHGHSSSIYRYPEKGFISVIITNNNVAYNGNLSYDIRHVIMNNYLKKIVTADKNIDPYKHTTLDTFSGLYWDENSAVSRKISVENDTLKSGSVGRNGGRALIPMSESSFILETGYRVEFEFLSSKRSTKLNIIMYDYKEPGSTLISYAPPVYQKNELKIYTGKFYSKYLDKFMTIQFKDSSLILIREDGSEVKLIPFTKDMFLTEARYFDGIKFKKINDSFQLSILTNGAKDIKFSKVKF